MRHADGENSAKETWDLFEKSKSKGMAKGKKGGKRKLIISGIRKEDVGAREAVRGWCEVRRFFWHSIGNDIADVSFFPFFPDFCFAFHRTELWADQHPHHPAERGAAC